MTVEWKDASNWRRDEERGEPRAWECRSGNVAIWIGRNHRFFPGEWVMHCFALGMDSVELGFKADAPVAEVKAAAIRKVRAKMIRLHVDIDAITAATLAEDAA